MSTENKPIIGITTDLKDRENSIETAYSKAIEYHGGVPILIPTIKDTTDFVETIVRKIDGLLIPGSRDMDPKFYKQKLTSKINPVSMERTLTEFKAMEESLKLNIPILGVCGGMQFINVFYGGSLYQDIKKCLPHALNHEDGTVHKIKLTEGAKLFDLFNESEFEVNSYHHQAVMDMGNTLVVNATSSDGIVEGFEKISDNVLAVQWHPELEDSNASEVIFKDFLYKASVKKR